MSKCKLYLCHLHTTIFESHPLHCWWRMQHVILVSITMILMHRRPLSRTKTWNKHWTHCMYLYQHFLNAREESLVHHTTSLIHNIAVPIFSKLYLIINIIFYLNKSIVLRLQKITADLRPCSANIVFLCFVFLKLCSPSLKSKKKNHALVSSLLSNKEVYL